MTSEVNWLRIDEVIEDIIDRRGITPLKLGGDFVESGHRVISAKLIKDGRIDLGADAPRFVDTSVYIKWMKTPLRAGDVIMTSEAPLGELAYLNRDKDWCLGQRLFALRPHQGIIDGRFLYYALQTSQVRADILGRATGTTVQGIRQVELRKVKIPVPALPAQLYASSILGALDDRITLLRETNATLEEIAQTLFKSWFVDFDPVRAKQDGRMPEGMDEATARLFPASFTESEIGAVPTGWSAATLGSICAEKSGAIQTGPFGSQLHASDYRSVGVPVVMPQDLAGRRVQVDKIARVDDADASRLARHRLQRGDIVFSRRGDVGRHALVGDREVGWLCGTGCLLVRPGQAWPSSTYLSLALDRAVAKEWLLRHAVGATMPNLNTGILSAVPVLRPDDRVLQAFDGIVRALDERISHGHANIRALVELRDTLLPPLISGKLRLPDAFEVMKQAA